MWQRMELGPAWAKNKHCMELGPAWVRNKHCMELGPVWVRSYACSSNIKKTLKNIHYNAHYYIAHRNPLHPEVKSSILIKIFYITLQTLP